MTSQRVVSVLMLAVPCLVSASTTYEGYGTVYTLSSPSSGNCNFMSWADDAVTKYAALNTEQWEETMNCGRCAEVSCTDASCSGQSEIVYIMDQCPGCAYGDLDLSPDVFESITGQSYTKLSIEWKFVDCPISNNVQYCLKTGSSEFWVAVQPANFVSGVQSLSINGQETSVIDSAYYFLIDGIGESVADLSSISISVTGVNGEVLEETLSLTADECTEGSSQFASSDDVFQTTITVPTPKTTPTPTTAAPTTAPITDAPATAPPTAAPATEAPTTAPVTSAPSTEAPTVPVAETPTTPTAPPTTAPVTTAPPTKAPTTAPVTEAPTSAPPTEAPTTMAPVTTTPVTETFTTDPVTNAPTSHPTAILTAIPTSTPKLDSTPNQVVSVASSRSDSSRSSSSSTDRDVTTSNQAAVSTNLTSSNYDEGSVSTSVSSERSSTSTAQVTPSSPIQTPSSTPSATEASVQEEASSSSGLHSTAAVVGLIAAVCVALGAVIGVAMVEHKKRKLLEERKNMDDRLSGDSLASYASIRTPRSEVLVNHRNRL